MKKGQQIKFNIINYVIYSFLIELYSLSQTVYSIMV